MNKHDEYQNHASAIIQIYKNLGTVLTDRDLIWIDSIFSVTATLDDVIDQQTSENAVEGILSTLKTGIIPEGFKEGPMLITLREQLLSLPQGEERLSVFLRTLKRLFRHTANIAQAKDISAYFYNSLLEGRTFGKLVAIGVEDRKFGRIISRAGGMENLTDDILDGKSDFQNGERALMPNTKFYVQGFQIVVSEILRLNEDFGLKKSYKAIRGSFRSMLKKYILDPMRVI